ncbi:hypothetical protein JNW93_12600 [Lacticaseibacillus rhamnosus]|uniref:hypothetical protein n=1 Tax=Lacticaseibacillus rhamnosus TaxID=47715 RepID=UPI0019515A97|nr:hypothetical protein [Lacticaseibacillus rhamnosus]MBM6441519.1 hypothetical protein [Lacticaseibacillus rhamnosus]
MDLNISFSLGDLLSIAALILSLFSLAYTRHFNQYELLVNNLSFEVDRGQKLISFSIFNSSNRPITITELTLIHNGKRIDDNGFGPDKFDKDELAKKAAEWDRQHSLSVGNTILPTGINPHLPMFAMPSIDLKRPFEQSLSLAPYESVFFSYYVDDLPDHIRIDTDKHFNHCHKYKLFTVKFDHVS